MNNQPAYHADAKFMLGTILIGLKLSERLAKEDIITLLGRHQSLDCGDVDSAEQELNDWAYKNGSMISSAYKLDAVSWVVIFTEIDEHRTTVYLADE